MRFSARLIYWIVSLTAAAVIIVFCVVNRTVVTVSFKPFPLVIELPIFLLVMGTFVLGALVGGMLAWAGGHTVRRRSRERGHRIRELEKQLIAAEQKAARPAPSAAPALPPSSRDAA